MKKKITVKTRKTSQVHFRLLPGVSSVTDTQHHREPMQIPAASCHLKLIPHWGWQFQSWLHQRKSKKLSPSHPAPSTAPHCKLFLLPDPWHRFYPTALYLGTEIIWLTHIPKVVLESNKASRVRLQKEPASLLRDSSPLALGKADFQGHTCITGGFLDSFGSKKAPSFRRQSVPTTFHSKVWASDRNRGSLTKPTPKGEKKNHWDV